MLINAFHRDGFVHREGVLVGFTIHKTPSVISTIHTHPLNLYDDGLTLNWPRKAEFAFIMVAIMILPN